MGLCVKGMGLNPSSVQILGASQDAHAQKRAHLPAQLLELFCRGQALPLGVLSPLQRLLAAGLSTPLPVGHLLGVTLQLEAVPISERRRRHPECYC